MSKSPPWSTAEHLDPFAVFGLAGSQLTERKLRGERLISLTGGM